MLLESDEYEFLFDVGCSVPATTVELWDRDRIVQTLANYYTVVSAKVQIDQLVSGLDTLGVIDQEPTRVEAGSCIFTFKPMTADDIITLFQLSLSPQGSNKREEEEAVVILWIHFIQAIEGEFEMVYIYKQ